MIFPKYRDKEGVSHMVQEQLEEVRQNIRNACERSGRKVEVVTLIAVSKTKPVPMLQEAYDAGARDFGENKVQEILEKEPQLPSDIRWHMIGHLQKNKVRQVIDKAVLIHSVDTVGLAEQIEKEAVKRDLDVSILGGQCRRRRVQIWFCPGRSRGSGTRNCKVPACPHTGTYDDCTICREFGRKSWCF